MKKRSFFQSFTPCRDSQSIKHGIVVFSFIGVEKVNYEN